ncbi:thiamine phosphate synthase [Luteitalea sp.]|jgi:thiamine-phosphate diphosphorylase|uniref:thiamine phosphate synthase n=1 Tax=Luteitalea sp. TaxID=2004800 RepID=UPI0037C678B9
MWAPRTLAITHQPRLGGRGPDDEQRQVVRYVAALAGAGVDAIQVREREWPDGRLVSLAREAVVAVRGTACRLLLNERAHVALAAQAHGVHLRGAGVSALRLRPVVPADWVIGRSVHASDGAGIAEGADYALFGTVWASGSKPMGAPVAGVDGLSAWVASACVPVVAVGGVTLARCATARAAGASGMAGIDVFVEAWRDGTDALERLVREVHAVFQDVERAE